jgi:hypothetical protein
MGRQETLIRTKFLFCLRGIVDIDTDYKLDDRSSIPGSYKRLFWGHPASNPISTAGLSPGVKALGRDADSSSPSSAEVKNGGAIPSFPHTFHGMVLN